MSSGECQYLYHRGSCYCWESKARPRTNFNKPLDSGVRIISHHSWSTHFARLFPLLFSTIVTAVTSFFPTQPMRRVVIAVYSFLPSGFFPLERKGSFGFSLGSRKNWDVVLFACKQKYRPKEVWIAIYTVLNGTPNTDRLLFRLHSQKPKNYSNTDRMKIKIDD